MSIFRLPPLLLAAALVGATPAAAQTAPDPVQLALQRVQQHQVNLKVGCPIPVPALWNAPRWEQEAAARRRDRFDQCLSGAMEREQQRLYALAGRLDSDRAADPSLDWTPIDGALETKWSELSRLEDKLRNRDRWADTAVNILDTFTGPGAPFDTSGANRVNPYAAPYSQPYISPQGYRRDTSVSFPGIK